MRFRLTLWVFCLVFGGCTRHQPQLAGTWLVDQVDSGIDRFQSTTVVRPDGIYVCRYVKSAPSGVREGTIEGRFEIKNGFLLDTMTKHSNTNAVLPHTWRARIVRFNERELVLAGVEGNTNETVFRRRGR